MLSWAITFFVIAIIAAVLGFAGVAGVAGTSITWAISAIGVMLGIIFILASRVEPDEYEEEDKPEPEVRCTARR